MELVAEHADGLARLDRRADAAKGVVLVRRRHPEQGDDRIADELLDMAAVPLECRRHRAEVAVHHPPHGLGVELLAELRRPGHVREEHGHDPPGRGRLVLTPHRSRAGGAEPGPLGQRLAAPRARRVHAGSIAVTASCCQGAAVVERVAPDGTAAGTAPPHRPVTERRVARGTTCVTTGQATFPLPITLTLYKHSTTNPATGEVTPGAQIAKVTKSFGIRFRPTSTPSCGAGGGFLGSDGVCHTRR